MTSESQSEVIRRCKGLTEQSSHLGACVIPIRNERGEHLGILDPLTKTMTAEDEPVALLTRWRNEHMTCFFTQFTATTERTRAWLNNLVLKDDARLLFLIRTPDNRAVGNFGICNLTPTSVEMDNAIRGERGEGTRLIFYTYLTLLRWVMQSFGVDHFYGNMFSDNFRSDRLHETVGFRKVSICRLLREERKGEIRYVADPASAPHPGEVGCTRVELTAAELLARHPWLANHHG